MRVRILSVLITSIFSIVLINIGGSFAQERHDSDRDRSDRPNDRERPDQDNRRDRWNNDRNSRDYDEVLIKVPKLPIETSDSSLKLDLLKELKIEDQDVVVESIFVIAKSNRRSRARMEISVNSRTESWVNLSNNLESYQTYIGRSLNRGLEELSLSIEGDATVEYISAAISGRNLGQTKDLTIEERISGIFEKGTFDSNRQTALNDYNARCANWKKLAEQRYGDSLRYLSCGTLSEKGGNAGYQFESNARVVIATKSQFEELEFPIQGIFERGTFDSNRQTALSDYTKRCSEFQASVLNDHELVGYISCGTLTEVGGNSGYQYKSVGRVFLNTDFQVRTIKETVVGIFEKGTFDSDRQQALKDYEARCETWKAEIRRFNGDNIIMLNCGAIYDSGGSSGYQYKSDATAILFDD